MVAGRRGSAPSRLLLLCAALAIGSASAVINLGAWELLGRQQNCWGPNNVQADKKTPVPGALSEAACYQCVDDAAQTSTTPFDKTYGCWTFCQANNSLVMPTAAASEDCRKCVVSSQVQDPYACQTCIFDTCKKDIDGKIVSCDAAARSSCYDCVKQYPKGEGSKEYYYACSACALLADVKAAYDHCTVCVATILTPEGKGILPDGWGDDFDPEQSHIPSYQFGKCVSEGQLIRAIVKGEEKPTGVQSLCFDAEDKYGSIVGKWRPKRTAYSTTEQPPVGLCTTCVYTSYNGQFDPIKTSPKSYACAEYCMDPNLVHNEDQMDQCTACVTNPLVTDPWGCQNCMAVNNGGSDGVADDANKSNRQKCFDCLTLNPYNVNSTTANVNFTNYPWACGQCASIPTGARQDSCYKCIQNKTVDYPIYTSNQLCECIDATVNAGTTFDRGLDAFERSCLSNWTVDILFGPVDLQMIYLAVNNTLLPADLDALKLNYLGKEVYETPLNPRWALHRLAGFIDPAISGTCLDCMSAQKSVLTSAATDKRFACRQYCMDPQLINTPAQAKQCSDAVNSVRVSDAWGVQNCLVVSTTIRNYSTTDGYPNFVFTSTAQASAPTDNALIRPSDIDADIRDWCFRVLLKQPRVSTYDSFAWGVGQCAQIKPSDAEILAATLSGTTPFSKARADCEDCLIAGQVDPCQCVEVAKNPPDLPDVPVGEGICTQPSETQYLVPRAAGGFTCERCPDGTSNFNWVDPSIKPLVVGSSNDRWAAQIANPNFYGVGKGFYYCLCNAPRTVPFPAPVAGASTGIFPTTGSANDFKCLCPAGQWYSPPTTGNNGICNVCPVGTTLNTATPSCSTSNQDCCVCDDAATTVFDALATAAPFCKCISTITNGYINTSATPIKCQVCPPGTALPTNPPANPVYVDQCKCTAANTVRGGEAPNYICECKEGYFLSAGVCTVCPDDTEKKDSGNDKSKCICKSVTGVNGVSIPLVLNAVTGVCECPAATPHLIMDGNKKKCVSCTSITWGVSYDSLKQTCVCAAGHGIFNKGELTCAECPDADLDKFCNCPNNLKNKRPSGPPQSINDCGCDANEEQIGKFCNTCDADEEIDSTTNKKCVCKSIKYDAAADQALFVPSNPKNFQCVCKANYYMDSSYRCKKCPFGQTSDPGSRGLDKCKCLPKSTVGPGDTVCKCPKDTYLTATGCVSCPGNTRTTGRGATSITDCGCHPKLVKLPAGNTVSTSKCYCPKETYGPGDDDDSKCVKCPLGATSTPGDDQRRPEGNCRCKNPLIQKLIRGADDKCEKDKNKWFCACPPGTIFNPNAVNDADVCSNCAAGGTSSCLGANKCGYKLFLEVFQPGATCTGRKIVAADVLSCWQQRAKCLPGFIQQCNEDTVVTSDCSVKVSLVFDSINNLKAAILYFRNLKPGSVLPYKEYFPDASFVNTCAKLPCGVQMRMSTDAAITALADFYPKVLFYTCGTSKYNELTAGHTNMPSDALCTGTDASGKAVACACNSCPGKTFWHYDRDNNKYKYDGGSVGNCGKKWFAPGTADECIEFHGACCAKFKDPLKPGRCPTHTCAGNELGDRDEIASHACTCSGTCGRFVLSGALETVAPKCARTAKKLLRQLLGASEEEAEAAVEDEDEVPDLLEIAQGAGRDLLQSCDGKYSSSDKGYCSDKKNFGRVTQSFGAFCDYTAYGGGVNDTGKTPRFKHVLGRVTCHKNGVKGSCATLYPGTDVAKVDGMDCFADINGDNWKLCNWHYNDNDKCKNYNPALPMCADTADWCQPGVWKVDRWNNGAVYNTPSTWRDVSTGVDMCNPASPGACHGFCNISTGICPTYSCANPNAAHINTNNLGPVENFCAIDSDTQGNKYCTNSGKEPDGKDRDDTCPFSSKNQYARCVKYNPSCISANNVCLGRVTCFTQGGTAVPCKTADGSSLLAGWDGVDCMLPISASATGPKEFKICACSTPQNVFTYDRNNKIKKCTKGHDGGKPEGDDRDDRNNDGKPIPDFKSCKKVFDDSRKDGGEAGKGCWQDWSKYRCWGDN